VPKLRLPIRGRRGGRWLALGVAAAVLALPGVAHAAPAPDPGGVLTPGSLPGPAGDLVDQLTDQTQQGGGSTSADSPAPQQQASPQDTTTQGTPAPPSLPPQLQQALDQLQKKSPNPECSAAIQADLTKLLTDIPTLITAIVDDLLGQLTSGSPPDPQDLLGQLQDLLGQLQGQSATAADASPTPDPTVILADLQQLVTDLTTKCLPAPPTVPSPPGNPPPPGNAPPPPAQGVSRPQPVQPVSYPGYAPTGSIATTALRPASDQRPPDPVPLSALGGVLLGGAAAAVAMRSRAGRGGR
jgi:hypothetical protein